MTKIHLTAAQRESLNVEVGQAVAVLPRYDGPYAVAEALPHLARLQDAERAALFVYDGGAAGIDRVPMVCLHVYPEAA